MKNKILTAFLFSILLSACVKDHSDPDTHSVQRIKSLTETKTDPWTHKPVKTVLNFSYDVSGNLKLINNTELFYTNRKLTSTVEKVYDSLPEKNGSYVHRLYKKQSYIWDNNKIQQLVLDSFYERISDNRYSNPGSFSENVNMHQKIADFFYNNDQSIDSIAFKARIKYTVPIGTTPIDPELHPSQKFFYEKNEIAVMEMNEETIIPMANTTGVPFIDVNFFKRYEFRYLDKPHYLYPLYKQLGVLPDILGAFVVPEHLPAQVKTTVVPPDGIVNPEPELPNFEDIFYDYNSRGNPVKIIYNKGKSNERTIEVSYY